MRRWLIFYGILNSIFFTQNLQAQILKQDPGFGKNGLALSYNYFTSSSPQNFGRVLFTDSQGRSIIFGAISDNRDFLSMMSVAFTPSGKPDSTYGINGRLIYPNPVPGGFAHASVLRAIHLSGGGYLLAGYAKVAGDNTDAAVLKLNEDGTQDTTWGIKSWALINAGGDDYLYGIAEISDGSFIVGGRSYRPLGKDVSFLSKFKSNGFPDTTFGNKGMDVIASDSTFYLSDLVVGKGKRIFISGNLNPVSSTPVLVSYHQNGKPDSAFGGTGWKKFTQLEGYLSSLETDAQGRLLATGTIREFTYTLIVLLRFWPDGNPDTSFTQSGIKFISRIGLKDEGIKLHVRKNGNFCLLGRILDNNKNQFSCVVIEFDTAGNYIPMIRPEGHWVQHISYRDDDPRDIATDGYDHIYVAGTYESTNQVGFTMLTRLGYTWPAASDQAFLPGIGVYPNPAGQRFMLKVGRPDGTMRIREATGRLILENVIRACHTEIDLHTRPGVYLVEYEAAGVTQSCKLVIGP